jgi:hypothetical protein
VPKSRRQRAVETEPSNFRAMSRRHQARIVSGLATQANFSRALRPIAFRSQQVYVARDPTGAIVLASGRGEFGSPHPGTRSAGVTPGSPALHTPVDEPTDCPSCELFIIADFLILGLFEYFDRKGSTSSTRSPQKLSLAANCKARGPFA